MTTIKSILSALAYIAVTVLVIFFLWEYGRKIHYSLNQEDLVKDTICKMVKEEHLKVPCDSKS